MTTTAYRVPQERAILALTLILVFLVIVLTATATFCLTFLATAVVVTISYAHNRSHHEALLARAEQVTHQKAARLASIVDESVARLQTGPVKVFVAPSHVLNAYTFGLTSPKVVVLNSALLEVMDADEIRFILGHELGHVRLGHTWLNSLVGGMAGMPSPVAAAIVLMMAFRWWNRACEISADRAGLLACGSPHKAISALVKLAAGTEAHTRAGLERTLRRIEAEDDHALSELSEALTTHPMTIRRIEELQRYAASSEYRRLQPLLDRNLSLDTGR